jgi:hypothetical protein
LYGRLPLRERLLQQLLLHHRLSAGAANVVVERVVHVIVVEIVVEVIVDAVVVTIVVTIVETAPLTTFDSIIVVVVAFASLAAKLSLRAELAWHSAATIAPRRLLRTSPAALSTTRATSAVTIGPGMASDEQSGDNNHQRSQPHANTGLRVHGNLPLVLGAKARGSTGQSLPFFGFNTINCSGGRSGTVRRETK